MKADVPDAEDQGRERRAALARLGALGSAELDALGGGLLDRLN